MQYRRGTAHGDAVVDEFVVPREWDKTYGAIPATDTVVKHNRTLRDRPNEFVIGNVRAGWHVRTTHETKAGYTKVYVPVLHKWGWLQL